MRFIKKIALFGILSGVFLLSGTAFAFYSSSAAYQDLDTNSVTIPSLGFRVQGVASTSINTFINQEWKMKIRVAIGNRFQFNLYWNGGAQVNAIDFLTDGTVISSSTGVTALERNGEFYTISYSAFQPTNDVYLQFRPITSSADVYGTNTNNYLEGAFCETGNNPYTGGCPPSSLIDAFFIFSETGEAPPADNIEIISPTSTPAYDFSNWQLGFATATSTTATSTHFYLQRVYVGLSSSTIETFAGGVGVLDSPVSVPNVGALSPNTTYFSQAQLWYFHNFQANKEVVATSDIVSFTTSNLSENELSYFDAPFSTSTTAEWTFTCDPTSGFFTNSFCNLARFLFVPTPASIQNFSDLKSQIETKPPIGYFSLIGEAFDNINASGTPAFTLTGVQALEDNFLTPFKAILTIVFYLLFGFWLLHRVRNFDFHL